MATSDERPGISKGRFWFAAGILSSSVWCWIFATIAMMRGCDLSNAWGGMAVGFLGSWLTIIVNEFITQRRDGRVLLIPMLSFLPLMNDPVKTIEGRFWSEIVVTAAWASGLSFCLWTLSAVVRRTIDQRRAAKRTVQRQPMWDAEADRPTLARSLL